MKTYHIGLLVRGNNFVFQYAQSVDCLDCEILQYFGARQTTKKAAKYRLRETQKETLTFFK